MATSIEQLTRKIKEQYKNSTNFRNLCYLFAGLSTYPVLRIIYEKITRKIYGLPDGLYGIPWFGNAFQLQSQNPSWLMAVGSMGSALTVLNGQDRTILFNDPIIANKVLSNKKLSDLAPLFIDDEERNFASANGKIWHERRRLFHNNFTLNLTTSFVERATKDFFKKHIYSIIDDDIKNNHVTNIPKIFKPVAFNVVSLVCLGKELPGIDDEFYLNWISKASKVFNRAGTGFFIQFLFNGPNILANFVSKLVCGGSFADNFDKLSLYLEKFINDDSKYVDLTKYPNLRLFNDFINEYNGRKYTKKALIADMGVAFFGAMDTIWMTLTVILLQLAKNMKLQNEVYNEIRSVFGDNIDDISITVKTLNKLPKLRAFLHEAMRVSGLARLNGQKQVTFNGLKIKDPATNKTYNIPKGTHTMTNVYYISRKPQFWVENYDENIHGNINMDDIHLEFWLDKDGNFSKKKNSASFFAFGKGNRSCPGQTLAMRVMPIILVLTLLKYKVIHPDGLKKFDINLFRQGFANEPTIQDIQFIKRN